jgi:hypothetical protein
MTTPPPGSLPAMTEQVPPSGPDQDEAETRAEPTRTGMPRVDAVLADIEGLDDVPLEQHTEAFERAHESLRAALDETPAQDEAERPDEPSDDPA